MSHVTLWNDTKVTHYNNDNLMCVSMGFDFFSGLFNVKTHDTREENVTTRSEI
jgi:hypothetical protein